MRKNSDMETSLLCIGIGLGMCIAIVLLFSFYYVYIDMAANEEWVDPLSKDDGDEYNEIDAKNEVNAQSKDPLLEITPKIMDFKDEINPDKFGTVVHIGNIINL